MDAIIFDTTNGPIYEETWTTILEAFADYEPAAGELSAAARCCWSAKATRK